LPGQVLAEQPCQQLLTKRIERRLGFCCHRIPLLRRDPSLEEVDARDRGDGYIRKVSHACPREQLMF
jgi:hypothetical protein